MEHDVMVFVSPWSWQVLLGAGLLAFAAVWAVLAWRRGNRIPFFGVAMYLIPLGPASGIIAPINSLFYEHWLYLSLFGAAVLLSSYGVGLWRWTGARSRVFGAIILTCAMVYGAWFAVQVVQRNHIWTDPEGMYNEILSYEPKNVRVLNNLANIYADRQEPERAREYWERASEADPTQPAPYHNLGNLARDEGDLARAEELYLKAINTQQTFHYAYRNLAGILLEQERYEEALRVLLPLRDIVPQDPSVHYAIALVLHTLGRNDQALEALQAGVPTVTNQEHAQAYQQLYDTLTR
jgi:tetratricopeptide (TPR) repeat protein